MLKSIRHKRLKRLWENNDSSKLNPEHVQRLRVRLTALDIADCLDDIDNPGWRLHQLNDNRWSINVSGN
jgi:proteic killer suppression protein